MGTSISKNDEDKKTIFTFTLDDIPCDLSTKLASIGNFYASYINKEESGGFCGLNKSDIANISLNMVTRIVLKKFHLKIDDKEFLNRMCDDDKKIYEV